MEERREEEDDERRGRGEEGGGSCDVVRTRINYPPVKFRRGTKA